MSIAALIRRMADAGASPEAIAIAVEAIEDEQAKDASRRAKNAERKAKQRAGQSRDSHATVTTHGRDNPSPKEKSPTPPKEITPSREPNGSVSVGKARANDLADFKAELSDLDPERLDAIIKHRRVKRGQLTGHAAKLFRQDADACGLSLADAVDTCISRNWITVKPEYLAGRQQSRPARQATSPPNEMSAAFDAIASGRSPYQDRNHEPDFPTIETSYERRN